MFPDLAKVRAGEAPSEKGMEVARGMNNSRGGDIKDLHDVQTYLENRYLLNGRWDPRISSSDPKHLPARVASWVLLVSNSGLPADIGAQQRRGHFQAYHAQCIWFLYAQHQKKKVWATRNLSGRELRDESAGAENNIAAAAIGMLNDMKKYKLAVIILPTATYDVNQLIEEGIRAAGLAVQLRTEKFADNPAHRAYPAALKNFASILRLAAEYEDDPQIYMTEAANLDTLAANVEQKAVSETLAKVDACLGVARGVDSAALERGKCVLCLTAASVVLGTGCLHRSLCEPCFSEVRGQHTSDIFGCLVCRQVSEHAVR